MEHSWSLLCPRALFAMVSWERSRENKLMRVRITGQNLEFPTVPLPLPPPPPLVYHHQREEGDKNLK